MTLKEVLKNKNIEGTPYRSDIERMLGEAWRVMSFREKEEFIDKLTEVQGVLNGSP